MTDFILTQLEALHIKVDQVEKRNTPSNFIVNTSYLSSFLNKKNVTELLIKCR